jgi:hypothetical protein
MLQRNADRNREIFANFRTGTSVNDLACQYRLAPITVRQLIHAQRHLLAVSKDPTNETVREKVNGLVQETKIGDRRT